MLLFVPVVFLLFMITVLEFTHPQSTDRFDNRGRQLRTAFFWNSSRYHQSGRGGNKNYACERGRSIRNCVRKTFNSVWNLSHSTP